MKNKKIKKIIIIGIVLGILVLHNQCTQRESTKYVNPFIGTGGKGHTYPGATVPHGMVQLSPDNGYSGWDRISGYYYPDTIISSFSHTHFSGTGIGDLYDIAIMPAIPPLKTGQDLNKTEVAVYSEFSHKKEYAEPGYYSVYLEDYDIQAEMTTSQRVGFHRYTFPRTHNAMIFVNLSRSLNWDNTKDSKLEIAGKNTIQGYRFSRGWAKNQKVYFRAEFSKSFNKYKIDTTIIRNKDSEKIGAGYIGKFYFDTRIKEKILVKVGISPVSIEGAKNNIEEEVPHWDFENVHQKAKKAWNNELSTINIKIDNKDQRILFYTALYQSMLVPTIFCDVDGRYFGPDYKIHKAENFTNYSTFSLWDTFRAAHPLYTILQPDRVNDMIKSMLHFYEQHGKLPQWAFWGNETNCMIGYHAIPVIVDAYLKGLRDYDENLAWEACYNTAMSVLGSLPMYKKYEYVPSDLAHSSVSKTLEYAFDDWCIAEFAKAIEKESTADQFYSRADYYQNVFDSSTGFMRGKNSRGEWISPFNPLNYTKEFTESNGWHYLWFVPHNIQNLIELIGGPEKFTTKLDSFFTIEPRDREELPIFSTGMIGQYVHGNEPSHHVAYLYNYAGKPWKTQERVREIMTTKYKNSPDGLAGNEDCGQLASWFVFSALGFYPVNPASGEYAIGSPLIDQATINLPEGKKFKIIAKNNSPKNIYIQAVILNDKSLKRSFIKHREIMAGGELKFIMGNKPNRKWATDGRYVPGA